MPLRQNEPNWHDADREAQSSAHNEKPFMSAARLHRFCQHPVAKWGSYLLVLMCVGFTCYTLKWSENVLDSGNWWGITPGYSVATFAGLFLLVECPAQFDSFVLRRVSPNIFLYFSWNDNNKTPDGKTQIPSNEARVLHVIYYRWRLHLVYQGLQCLVLGAMISFFWSVPRELSFAAMISFFWSVAAGALVVQILLVIRYVVVAWFTWSVFDECAAVTRFLGDFAESLTKTDHPHLNDANGQTSVSAVGDRLTGEMRTRSLDTIYKMICITFFAMILACTVFLVYPTLVQTVFSTENMVTTPYQQEIGSFLHNDGVLRLQNPIEICALSDGISGISVYIPDCGFEGELDDEFRVFGNAPTGSELCSPTKVRIRPSTKDVDFATTCFILPQQTSITKIGGTVSITVPAKRALKFTNGTKVFIENTRAKKSLILSVPFTLSVDGKTTIVNNEGTLYRVPDDGVVAFLNVVDENYQPRALQNETQQYKHVTVYPGALPGSACIILRYYTCTKKESQCDVPAQCATVVTIDIEPNTLDNSQSCDMTATQTKRAKLKDALNWDSLLSDVIPSLPSFLSVVISCTDYTEEGQLKLATQERFDSLYSNSIALTQTYVDAKLAKIQNYSNTALRWAISVLLAMFMATLVYYWYGKRRLLHENHQGTAFTTVLSFVKYIMLAMFLVVVIVMAMIIFAMQFKNSQQMISLQKVIQVDFGGIFYGAFLSVLICIVYQYLRFVLQMNFAPLETAIDAVTSYCFIFLPAKLLWEVAIAKETGLDLYPMTSAIVVVTVVATTAIVLSNTLASEKIVNLRRLFLGGGQHEVGYLSVCIIVWIIASIVWYGVYHHVSLWMGIVTSPSIWFSTTMGFFTGTLPEDKAAVTVNANMAVLIFMAVAFFFVWLQNFISAEESKWSNRIVKRLSVLRVLGHAVFFVALQMVYLTLNGGEEISTKLADHIGLPGISFPLLQSSLTQQQKKLSAILTLVTICVMFPCATAVLQFMSALQTLKHLQRTPAIGATNSVVDPLNNPPDNSDQGVRRRPPPGRVGKDIVIQVEREWAGTENVPMLSAKYAMLLFHYQRLREDLMKIDEIEESGYKHIMNKMFRGRVIPRRYQELFGELPRSELTRSYANVQTSIITRGSIFAKFFSLAYRNNAMMFAYTRVHNVIYDLFCRCMCCATAIDISPGRNQIMSMLPAFFQRNLMIQNSSSPAHCLTIIKMRYLLTLVKTAYGGNLLDRDLQVRQLYHYMGTYQGRKQVRYLITREASLPPQTYSESAAKNVLERVNERVNEDDMLWTIEHIRARRANAVESHETGNFTRDLIQIYDLFDNKPVMR